MLNSRFYKINDKIVVNLEQISHFEFINDTMNPSRKLVIYLVRSSSGDRLTLNEKEANDFIKFLEVYDKISP